MKAEEVEVRRLFNSDDQLLIPAWQRRYSWTEDEWRELWADVARTDADPASSHFVGSVVLHAHEWHGMASEANRYSVVDGQQRVTSLTLLICAIRDRIARSHTDNTEAAAVRNKYTAQLLINGDLEPEYRPRLILQEPDHSALTRVVAASVSRDADTLVEKAYLFFTDRLSEVDIPSAERLLATIRKRMTAVWVVLQPGDNAHRVFQTLNAGGKPLQQVDLVRNYFFLLLGEAGNQFYSDHWRSLETDLATNELESYLVAWSVTEGHAGSKGALFEYFQRDLRRFETNPDAIADYGKKFVGAARLFRSIKHPTEITNLTPEVRDLLATLQRWGSTPAEGLLLFLLRHHQAGRLPNDQLERSLAIIFSFLARRFLAGYAPNRHRSIFVRTTQRLRSAVDSETLDIPTLLHATLSSGDDENSWPSDTQITERALSTPLYTRSRSRWVFLILERLNRTFFTHHQHVPNSLSFSAYTVEHILPQKLSPAWEADLTAWGTESTAALRDSHLHVLGNLTLSAVNSKMQNKTLSDKLEMLKDDTLKLNQALIPAEHWTAREIDSRGRELAARATTVFLPPLDKQALESIEAAAEATVHLLASALGSDDIEVDMENEEIDGYDAE